MKSKVKEKDRRKEYKTKKYLPIGYLLSILLIIIEVICVIGLVVYLCLKGKYFYLLTALFQVFCIVKIIASNDNPEYKAPWLFVVLVLPIAGFMLYFYFYSRKLGKRYVKRLKDISKNFYKQNDGELFKKLESEDKIAFGQAKMLCAVADSCMFTGVKQTYFSSGEQMMESLLTDIKNAKKFIFLEFFIIEKGYFWERLLNLLKEKVSEGVEVKIIYDDFGCMRRLPLNYVKTLKSFGIEATVFSPIRPPARSELNNRTHRKIVVIDGVIGYTGGVNVGDEYINEKSPFGHWKDCAVRLEGNAVWEFTELFLTDFGVSVKKIPEIKHDLYPSVKFDQDGYIIPFGDGPVPIYWRRVAQSAIQNMVDSATDYCYITTPYLIPDNALCLSLENASLRGVDVRITIPAIPDKKAVYILTKSYCHRLMKAGVKIYEYTPGFIHAKTYLVDGKYAIIGSVNLDYRSLAHNFENGVWMYKTSCINDIKNDLKQVMESSKLLNGRKKKIKPLYAFFCAIIRIFAPLM